MSFNIFGPTTQREITVGYIDPNLGYITGVSICDANKYAQKNPGTTFIFENRDGIRYLNINEVNQLTPGDLPSSTQCGISSAQVIKEIGRIEYDPVTGDPKPIRNFSDFTTPKVIFSGGGGVGAAGNPIIGEDGGLLAVDLVSGGFGYATSPTVRVVDPTGIGAGAVVRAVLVGEDPGDPRCQFATTQEVFDEEFEDYVFDNCDPEPTGYGQRYDVNGKPIGEWEPTLYATLEPSPIERQIKEYQDFLQKLSTPWWTTRLKKPLKVVSASRPENRTKHDVQHPGWGSPQEDSFMNKYAISPVPPSNAPGSDFAGQEFTMEWEEEFPYDGEYVFRAQADNLGRYYLDNEKLIETTQFKADKTPKFVKKTVKAGVHRIRIDLYNEPQYEVVREQQPVETQPNIPNQNPFQVVAAYSGVKNLVNNFKAGIYKITSTYDQDTGPAGIAIEIKNKTTGKVVFDTLQNINSSNVKLIPVTSGKYSVDKFTKNSKESQIFLQKSGVFPENIKDKTKTNIEWSNIYLNDTGDYEITASADDQIGFTISIVSGLPSNNNQQSQPSTQSSTQSTGTKTSKIFNTVDYIDKADRKLWRLDPRAGRDSGFINQYGILPFDPNSSDAQTRSFAGTHVIRWEYVEFPVDGNYNIEVMVDDNVTLYIGNRSGGGAKEIGNGLRSVDEGGDEVVIRKRGYSSPGRSTGKTLETKFFKAGKYRIRAELEQIEVGPLAKGNPMALAINIETTFTEKKVVSARSWNQNPMGAALIIDAPLPPIPQEPTPQQDGDCPPSPIWTTRFPGKEKWWPVNFKRPSTEGESWSKFTNRYAISPVPPLSKPGSDSGGVVYRNEWELDAPYDGYYGFKATVDNAGRILVDNVPIMQANYIPTNLSNTRGGSGVERRSGITAIEGDGIVYNWRENNPKSKKVFLRKGKHIIQVEVENGVTETFSKVNQKVFSTKDWIVSAQGPKTVDIDFEVFVGGQIGKTISIEELDIVVKKPFDRTPYPRESFKRTVEYGKEYVVKITDFDYKYYNPPGKIQLKSSGNLLQLEDWIENRFDDCYVSASIGKFFDIKEDTCKFIVTYKPPATAGGTSKSGVVYEGPTPIASYSQPITGRAGFISPAFQDINAKPNEEIQGKTWTFRWSNVDFPVTGQYTLEAEADDNLIVKVDGVQVGQAKVFEGRNKTTFNVTKGKKTVELILSNISIPNTGFQENPVVGFAEITVPVDKSTGVSLPWTKNPMGISAICIPPPCPKKVTGRGVVCKVIVDDPGNTYQPPRDPQDTPTGYPVQLVPSGISVIDTGLNYNFGVDVVRFNGTPVSYECDTFGRITKVYPPNTPITRVPEITVDTETGINFRAVPEVVIIRDPIEADPATLIQVTDLVGLKKTGYVEGRAYYGAVFYKNGIRYAGLYETAGRLVQVYDTLQESVDAQVVTPPSAIQRQGTDITTNDPRLNIPGTPDEIT